MKKYLQKSALCRITPLIIFSVSLVACDSGSSGGQEILTKWYKDADADAFGDPATEVIGDKPDNTYVANKTDCNDNNNAIFPGATEAADLVDNDCDGVVDNGFKHVFITSKLYTGNLGGLAGADAECQTLAEGATPPRPGKYAAWLSDSTKDAQVRVPDNDKNTDKYVVLKDLQTPLVIANGFQEVIDGSLANPISFSEKFNSFANAPVWTNTNATGGAIVTSAISTCGDWSGSGVTGRGGDGNSSDEAWTEFGNGACISTAFLYCFQK
jgi:hypothetical protein